MLFIKQISYTIIAAETNSNTDLCELWWWDFYFHCYLVKQRKKRFGCKKYLELKQNNFLISNSSNRKNSLSE